MQKSPPEFPQGHHTLFSLATPFTMALDVFSLLGVCALGAAWPVLWRPWRTQELPRTTALSPCSRVLWSERPASGKSQFSRMDAYRWEFMSCPVGVNIYTNNVLIILVTDVYELFLCVYLGFLFFFFFFAVHTGGWHLIVPAPRNDPLAGRNVQTVPVLSWDFCIGSLCPQPPAVLC